MRFLLASLLVSFASVAGCNAVLGVDFDEAQLGEGPAGVGPGGCLRGACNGQCGSIPDGCGGELQCAACGAGEVCGGRGPNRCGAGTCTAKSCGEIPGACGRVSDGCGAVLECAPCNGGRVPCALPWDPTLLLDDGASIQAYESAVAPFRTTCNVETRVCTRGVLSGSFGSESCEVAPPATCAGPGGTVAHGASVTAYAAAQVAWNATCQSQTRTCDNGVLSGDYGFTACTTAPPPGFSCPDAALARATLGCGPPPPQGPFIHRFRCSGANQLVDAIQAGSSGGGSTTFTYTGGTQSFPVPCVPGGGAAWTLTCQPVDAVIRCTVGGQTFDLPQL